jgi:hypothetical protein
VFFFFFSLGFGPLGFLLPLDFSGGLDEDLAPVVVRGLDVVPERLELEDAATGAVELAFTACKPSG